MKTSLAWLNSYLDRPTDAEEADRLLTAVGFPLDGQDEVVSGDLLLDVEVTSNRSDCLSHLGVAREVAAASGRTLNAPDLTIPDASRDASQQAGDFVTVTNDRPDLCPLYTARVIRNVKVGPSPDWLQERLRAIGAEPINNVADITNFVLMEMGQPLHAFDLDKLKGKQIIVRDADGAGGPDGKGEAMAALNGDSYVMGPENLVIADAEDPVAIAGVMGGELSKVTEETSDVLLEAALFDIVSVRQTVRSLKVKVHNKLGTESSFRFERGLDPNGVDRASLRCAQLICEIAGGTLVEGAVRVGPLAEEANAEKLQPKQLGMRVQRCRDLLGIDISDERMAELLGRLAFNPQLKDGVITCTVPTYRLDLTREIDLIEEVVRLENLDAIPVQDKIHINAKSIQPNIAARQIVGRVMQAHGYFETCTLTRLHEGHGSAFLRAGEEPVILYTEHHRDRPMLRPSVLPSLLIWRKANQNAGNRDVRLYETSSVFSTKDGQRTQRQVIGVLCDVGEDKQTTLRDVRGTLSELTERLGGAALLQFEPIADGEHPLYEAAANVLLNGEPIGVIGVLHQKPAIDKARGITKQAQDLCDLITPMVAAELELPPLVELYPPTRIVQDLPTYPAIERDLSVVVDEPITWAQIEATVRDLSPALMEDLSFMKVYRGKPIEKGQKSVSFRMLFRDPDATLRHEQVDPQVAAVVAALKDKLGAELRG